MTIPQADNRGPQSVTERRKVTFATETPGAGTNPPVAATPPTSIDDSESTACGDAEKHIKEVLDLPPYEFQGHQSSFATRKLSDLEGEGHLTSSRKPEKHFKDSANKSLYAGEHLEVNVKVVSNRDTKKSSLPILNFPRTTEASERSRKLSLSLPTSSSSPRQIPKFETTEKLRLHSQLQKASYQRVPQEDPSPSPDNQKIFTLQPSEHSNTEPKYKQHLSIHSAEVHAAFQETEKASKRALAAASSSSSSEKKVFFGKTRSLTRSHSSSCKSLDELNRVHHGGVPGKSRPVCLSRSASSEDLAGNRRRRTQTAGSGGNHPHRQPGDSCHSPGSPSRCCLVSVSRVPMAAATSHLTLDSDYQTVRLAILGAPGVGKSSIVRQFVLQQFMEEYVPTEQRQVFCPAVIINEHLYEVRIIDCPYIPYFPVNSLYEWTDFRGYGLRNATAYVLVYDITSEESFEYIKSLRLQILESRNCHDVPIFVVGNKHDLAEEKGVPRREVREVANMVKKQWKCGYIECSAKYNWHIMLLFKELMKTVDYIDYGHKPTSMRVQDALRRNRCLIL
ncbi:uncharacterized protein LOC131928096 [Physella acuta]|uniref:uncharacterized protein LOC131928096 n=1 Tax=Physella acuta TaxID=109671 RepID=UPI0027DC21F5|nr:uncharacterized protein LOC131928096 [Physella acuta]